MKWIEFPENKKHQINMGNPNAKVDPLSVQLYSEEIEQRADRDESYRQTKMNSIAKEYNRLNRKNNLRLVGEWLWDFVRKNGTKAITSYEEISINTKISESNARINVSKLNYWDGFPFTWIPVPKKAGYIQLSLNNDNDYYKWDLKKEKTIVSNEQVKEKAEKITPYKKQKEKVKVKIKN